MEYFVLFSNCVLTKGESQSIIADLQNKNIYFLPNELHEILNKLRTVPLKNLSKSWSSEDHEIVMEYLTYFEQQNLGFYTKTPQNFPDLSLNFETPELINNAIIDLNDNSNYDLQKVIKQLIEVECKYLQIRAYHILPILKIKAVLKECISGYFRNIDLIIKFVNDPDYFELLQNIMDEFPQIGSVYIHSSPENNKNSYFEFVTKVLQDETCCGVISKQYFSPSIEVFSESQKYNTCLNKKIAVDVEGNIKNCPSMSKIYGNAEDTIMKDVISIPSFRAKWDINKDQIEVCKSCEFRHICTDCRAYVEDPTNPFSKPLKCGYDPKTNEWEDWSKMEIKQKGIDHYKIKL